MLSMDDVEGDFCRPMVLKLGDAVAWTPCREGVDDQGKIWCET